MSRATFGSLWNSGRLRSEVRDGDAVRAGEEDGFAAGKPGDGDGEGDGEGDKELGCAVVRGFGERESERGGGVGIGGDSRAPSRLWV